MIRLDRSTYRQAETPNLGASTSLWLHGMHPEESLCMYHFGRRHALPVFELPWLSRNDSNMYGRAAVPTVPNSSREPNGCTSQSSHGKKT